MKLSTLGLDTLAEIFNHGVGQAGLALSELAGQEVQLSVPKIEELSKRAITDQMDARGANRICAVHQGFSGVINTDALLMLPVDQSLQLVQRMVGDEFPLEQLSEMEQESLAEVDSPSTLVSRADHALYAAKSAGRDRVFCFDSARQIAVLV
jgi:chemotaxis protein CheC